MATDASAQRLRLGAELRRLRESGGFSGEYVAKHLGWSQAKISRIEAGRTAFTVRDVSALLTAYGAADDVRAEMLGATAEDTGEGAWIVRAGGYPLRQGVMASLESVTAAISQYQPQVVPGLLQAPEYARAVMAAVGSADPDAGVAARVERQKLLHAPHALQYTAVIDARAFLLPIADEDLIRLQIRHVIEQARELPKVDVRIVPLGASASRFSTVGFTLYDFKAPESPTVAWVEAPTGDVYFSATADVTHYRELLQTLSSASLKGESAMSYLQWFASKLTEFRFPSSQEATR